MVICSIIIPTFNNRDTLPATLRCALSQDIDDVEVIVVNDAGEDPAGFLELSPADAARVRIIDKKSNAGVSSARNDGFEASCGEYVLFLDADDLVRNDFLRVASGMLARHGDAAALFAKCLHCPPEEALEEFSRLSGDRDNGAPSILDGANWIDRLRLDRLSFTTSFCLFRRRHLESVIEKTLWREDLRNAEDTHLLVRLALNYPCVTLDAPFGVYLVRKDSLSRNREASWRGLIAAMDMVIDEHLPVRRRSPTATSVRKLRNFGARQLARLLNVRGNRTGCLEVLREDLSRHPSLKNLIYFLRFRLLA